MFFFLLLHKCVVMHWAKCLKSCGDNYFVSKHSLIIVYFFILSYLTKHHYPKYVLSTYIHGKLGHILPLLYFEELNKVVIVLLWLPV